MFIFSAKVIPGRGLGRRIGFPTANLAATNLLLAYGVYLVKARLEKKIDSGLMHYGPKKTFNEAVSCEVYLKNFNKNIYGRTMEIEVGRKIREVKKFNDAEALKRQIKQDLTELNQGS